MMIAVNVGIKRNQDDVADAMVHFLIQPLSEKIIAYKKKQETILVVIMRRNHG